MRLIDTLKARLNPTSPENLERLRNKLPIEFPTELANPFMDYVMERSYLEEVSSRDHFEADPPMEGSMAWVRIDRLPVHPSDSDDYDLLSRWQSVLSSLHSWNERLLFLLQRSNGSTSIYLGMHAPDMNQSLARLETALINSMPGITTSRMNVDEGMKVITSLLEAKNCGALTGIPSFRRETKFQELQTLDSLAFGIRDTQGRDADFSLLVVADPIPDQDITDIISRMMELGTEIHKDVHKSFSAQEGVSTSNSASLGLGTLIGTVANMIPVLGNIAATIMSAGAGIGFQTSKSGSVNRTENTDFLNKFAEYTEKTLDKHCDRLRKGRNQGFWNTGVYVLSNLEQNVGTVLGMLRSVYSGDESYIEPIRIHRFKPLSGASNIVGSNLFPVPIDEMTGTSRASQLQMIAIFAIIVSTQSTTYDRSFVMILLFESAI